MNIWHFQSARWIRYSNSCGKIQLTIIVEKRKKTIKWGKWVGRVKWIYDWHSMAHSRNELSFFFILNLCGMILHDERVPASRNNWCIHIWNNLIHLAYKMNVFNVWIFCVKPFFFSVDFEKFFIIRWTEM